MGKGDNSSDYFVLFANLHISGPDDAKFRRSSRPGHGNSSWGGPIRCSHRWGGFNGEKKKKGGLITDSSHLGANRPDCDESAPRLVFFVVTSDTTTSRHLGSKTSRRWPDGGRRKSNGLRWPTTRLKQTTGNGKLSFLPISDYFPPFLMMQSVCFGRHLSPGAANWWLARFSSK